MTVDQNRRWDLDVSRRDESFVNPTLKTFGSHITCHVSRITYHVLTYEVLTYHVLTYKVLTYHVLTYHVLT